MIQIYILFDIDSLNSLIIQIDELDLKEVFGPWRPNFTRSLEICIIIEHMDSYKYIND